MEKHPTTGSIDIGRVDGNALAGPLSEIFRVDITMASGTCRSCAGTCILADAVVEADAVGLIVLCPTCTHTLFTVVRSPEGVRADLQGLAALSFAPTA
jgi:hypothetical protein